MERITINHKFPSDLYKAVVTVEKMLDAIEWCKEYSGQGSFAVRWVFNDWKNDDSDIVGEFGFSNKDDHLIFCLNWCEK